MVQAVIQTTVTGLQGNPVAAGTPTANQSLTWNGTTWASAGPFLPTTGGTLTGAAASTTLVVNGNITPGGGAPIVSILNANAATGASAGLRVGSGVISGSTDGTNVLAVAGATATLAQFQVNATTLAVGGSINQQGGAGNNFASQIICAQLIRSNAAIYAGNFDGFSGVFYQNILTANGQTLAVNQQTYGNAVAFMAQGTFLGSIAISSSGTTFNTTSDARLKTNVNPVPNAGALIDGLAPITFNWLTDAAGAPVSYGFVAQDVETIFPAAVTQGTGDPGQPGFQPWGMDEGKLMSLAVAELKALRARVAALETHAGVSPAVPLTQ